MNLIVFRIIFHREASKSQIRVMLPYEVRWSMWDQCVILVIGWNLLYTAGNATFGVNVLAWVAYRISMIESQSGTKMEGRVVPRGGLWWDRWIDWWCLGRCRMVTLLMVPPSSACAAASLTSEPMMMQPRRHLLPHVVCLWVPSVAWASPLYQLYWMGAMEGTKNCNGNDFLSCLLWMFDVSAGEAPSNL